MAIVESPPVANPQSDWGVGRRRVAISLQHDVFGLFSGIDATGPRSPGELVSLAGRLAHYAATWPGMNQLRQRRWELLAASEGFEAWVIGWPPGGAVELHDHGGSAGAVVVASGELVETSIVSRASTGVELQTRTLGVGESARFTGDHVHDVGNMADTPAISVHVYAPRLTSMTYYRVNDGVLEATDTAHYRFGEAVA